MSRWINLEGRPGTGKSTFLTYMFEAAVAQHGPTKVASITFTRPAAEELRQRAGKILRLGTRSDTLRKALPYVGTIHSLCYHAIGCPKVINDKSLKEFSDYQGIPGITGITENPEEVDGYWVPDDYTTGMGMGKLLKVISASKNRRIPISDAVTDIIKPGDLRLFRHEWFEAMAVRYDRPHRLRRHARGRDQDDPPCEGSLRRRGPRPKPTNVGSGR
jgi:hypothetical protein